MADALTLTLRLHDPLEKKDHEMSASWAVIEVDRMDLNLSAQAFVTKYIAPHLTKLKQLKLT
jgi:hypothetical protein